MYRIWMPGAGSAAVRKADRAMKLIEMAGYHFEEATEAAPLDTIRPYFFWQDADRAQPAQEIGGIGALRRDLIRRSAADREALRAEMATLHDALGKKGGGGQRMVDPARTELWKGRTRKVAGADVTAAVKASSFASMQLWMLDRDFWVVSEPHWQEIIRETRVDAVRYVSDAKDCDDYAIAFKGIVSLRYGVNSAAIVVDIEGQHAYNLLIADDGDGGLVAHAFEPQSDRIVDAQVGARPYNAERGYLIF